MTKRVRRSAEYFPKLPKGDPLAKAPRTSAEASGATQKAVNALVPGWAQEDVHDGEGDEVKGFQKPDSKQWEHLADDSDFEKDEIEARGPGHQSWVKTLVTDRAKGTADNPARVIEEDGVRLDKLWTSSAEGGNDSPLARLRSVGLQLASAHEGAKSPRFQRSNAEGVKASDYPLPGTSFAVLGVRGSFGRQQVTSVEIEADRLFYDDNDLRHAGKPDLKSAPLNAYKARKMKPGERYQVRTQRTILADAGAKYTPVPLPGISSSMFHDLGPGVSTEVTVAIEGDTTLEVVRGFASKVAVRLSARDERVKPGGDKSFKVTAGLFVDGSLLEYGAENFKGLAQSNVKKDLETLEDRRRLIDQKITPWTEKVNKFGAVSAEHRTKSSSETLNLVEVVFDLAKPDARKAFNQLVGANYRGARGIDFNSLEGLSPDTGVQLVRNNVTEASRTGVRRAFGAFGFEAQRVLLTEKRDTHKGPEGEGTTIKEQHHAQIRRNMTPGGKTVSTTVGRVKTVTDDITSESATGVGFGWEYEIEQRHGTADELAQVLAFAAEAGADPTAGAQLQALHDGSDAAPRRKFLGMRLGPRDFGAVKTGFRVEMNADAVRQLLGKLKEPEGTKELYRTMAQAYARQHGLSEVPDWPKSRLDSEGVMGAISRNMLPVSIADSAFLEARNALGALDEARLADDPVHSAKILAQAMSFLRHEMGMAGALVAHASHQDGSGVEVEVALPKIAALQAAEPDPAALPDSGN